MKKEKFEIVFEVSRAFVEGLMALAELGNEEERTEVLKGLSGGVRIDLEEKDNGIPGDVKAVIAMLAIGSAGKEL